jgi:hypothetical protein
MRGLLLQVRLGQARKAIKSTMIRPPPFYVHYSKFGKKHSRKGVTQGGLGDKRMD